MSENIIHKAILDNSIECIALLGKDHRILAFNKTIRVVLEQYFGKNIEIGDDYRDFVVPGAMELYLKTFRRAILGETVLEHLYTEGNGVSIWFEYIMNPVYDASNELIGVTLTAKNIDVEKRSQLALEELSGTLDAIIENSNQSVTLLDPDFRIILMNGISKKSIQSHINRLPQIGDDFREFLFEGKDEFIQFFEKALNGESSSSEIEYKDINERVFWYKTRINPVYCKNSSLIGVSVFAEDISEKKKVDLTLKEIAWHQSHIIRAPAARILGLIRLLTDSDKSNIDQEARFMLEQIRIATEELDQVIHEIVELTERKVE